MIWGRWEEPNRRVRATDPNGVTRRGWLTFAPEGSEEALRERFESKGYTNVEISPYDFQEWKGLAERAAGKVADAVEANQRPLPFRSAVWGLLKQHLFDLSGGRCAYCEAKVQHVDYGDVEHYRPKSAVKEDPTHPGYYWLAYETTNLLPSCGLCNKAPGKLDQFPVQGTRVIAPHLPLQNERPLLFNPYQEDPRAHLRFLANGDVVKRSEQGERMIAICRLRRLREERRELMEKLETDLKVLRIQPSGNLSTAVTSLVERLRNGQEEYCNALFDHLDHLIDEEERQIALARTVSRPEPGA